MHYPKTKMLLAAIPLLTSLNTFAQIEKGTKFIGGQIGGNRNASEMEYLDNSTETVYLNFSLNPRAGYFVSNSLALGLGLNYTRNAGRTTHQDKIFSQEDKSTDNNLALNIFGRYTKAVGRKFYLFLDGNISSGLGNRKISREQIVSGVRTYNETTVKSAFGTYVSLVVRPGIIYFISPKFGIETSYGSLGYDYAKQKLEGGIGHAKNSNIGLNFGANTLMFGANYYFKHKAKPIADQMEQE